MGAAKVGRSTSPLIASSALPLQPSSTNPTVESTTSYYSLAMDADPKDMPEAAFVLAFCAKFRCTLNNLTFWPEDLDEAVRCKEGPNFLIESLHKAFISNLELKKSRAPWTKRLAKLINDRRGRGNDLFVDHNPIERVNYDYYSLSNREKVMILQALVTWQLAESAEIKRIRKEHNEIVYDDEVRPMEVEVLGEDASGSRYYYVGIGARIYRESVISGRIKWETVSSTIEELRKFIFEYQGLDPNRSEQERVLYNKIITSVIPYLETLEIERIRTKEYREDLLHKVERNRESRLKKIEKIHNASEILLVRTRSQAKQAIHKEVKNTTGYLEIIKKPIDHTITTIRNDNEAMVNPSKRKFMDNVNGNIKGPEDPTKIQEVARSGNPINENMNPENDLLTTNKVPATGSSIQVSAVKDKDSSTNISTAVDISKVATVPLGEVIVENTFNGTVGISTSEDMSDRGDKRPSKDERSEIPKKVCRDNSSSKMNLSSILAEEVSGEAGSVGQRSELSKMAISNILSSECSDVVHVGSKYFDGEADNVNSEHVGSMFVQYGNGNVVSYEFDAIQKSNDNETTENEKVAPELAIQKDLQKEINTPNVSNDTIRTPWAPAVKKKGAAEVNDDAPSELEIKRAFVPDAEMMVKLEWSLNHPVFKLDEEIFGESTDTDLSECCSSCAMEID